MDAKQKRAFNLKVLRQQDKNVEDILDGTSYAVLYRFIQGAGWKKEMVEGSMFIFTRNVIPRYGLFILNRNGPENFITLFTGTDDLQLTDDYIIFRPADDDAIWGVWVFDPNHRPRIGKCIEEIEKLATKDKEALPAKTSNEFFDPAIASMTSTSTPSNNVNQQEIAPGQPLSVDDLFGNFNSPSISTPNIPLASTLPNLDQNFRLNDVQNYVDHNNHNHNDKDNVNVGEENVKAQGTQALLSFLGLPSNATVENTQQQTSQESKSFNEVPTLPPSNILNPYENHSQTPSAPLAFPLSTVQPQQQVQKPSSSYSQQSLQQHSPYPQQQIQQSIVPQAINTSSLTPEPSAPSTPLPLSAITPTDPPNNGIILNDELENLKKLTFEDSLKDDKNNKKRTSPQNFNTNFPPLGLSPPTAPKAEREKHQQQQKNTNDNDTPKLFQPGIRTHVRTVPRGRKLPLLSQQHSTQQLQQSPQVQKSSPQSQQQSQTQTSSNSSSNVSLPKLETQSALEVLTPALPLLGQTGDNNKMNRDTFKHCLNQLISENEEFINILYERYMVIGN